MAFWTCGGILEDVGVVGRCGSLEGDVVACWEMWWLIRGMWRLIRGMHGGLLGNVVAYWKLWWLIGRFGGL